MNKQSRQFEITKFGFECQLFFFYLFSFIPRNLRSMTLGSHVEWKQFKTLRSVPCDNRRVSSSDCL